VDISDAVRELGLSDASEVAEASAPAPAWLPLAFAAGIVITILTLATVIVTVIPALVSVTADLLRLTSQLTN
jgi:hypothetical protein